VGLIEDRLAHAIPKVWDDIFADPHPDLERCTTSISRP